MHAYNFAWWWCPSHQCKHVSLLFTEIFTDLCVEGEFDDHSLTPEAMRPVINTILLPDPDTPIDAPMELEANGYNAGEDNKEVSY